MSYIYSKENTWDKCFDKAVRKQISKRTLKLSKHFKERTLERGLCEVDEKTIDNAQIVSIVLDNQKRIINVEMKLVKADKDNRIILGFNRFQTIVRTGWLFDKNHRRYNETKYAEKIITPVVQ